MKGRLENIIQNNASMYKYLRHRFHFGTIMSTLVFLFA